VFGHRSVLRSRLGNMMAAGEEFFSKKLWHEFYRGTKVMSFQLAYEAHLRAGVPQQDAARMAAKSINSLHGGINWNWEGLSARIPQLASLGMLAPDWFLSNHSYSLNALFGSGHRAASDRMAFARVLLMNFLAGNMINKAQSGHWMFENDPGHRNAVEITVGGSPVWIEMPGTKHWLETGRALLSLYNNVAPRIGMDPVLEDEAYDSFDDYIDGKQSMLMQALDRAFTGQMNYPPNMPVPAASDYRYGTVPSYGMRPKGYWGKESKPLDPFGERSGMIFDDALGYGIYTLHTAMAIPMENLVTAAVNADRGDFQTWLSQVVSDPKIYEGFLGTKIKRR
jgi:hypothetical protein